MSITLGPNIASFKVINALRQQSASVQDSMERLSSGQRINSAADDSAGLALSTLLNKDAKLASVAKRNANEGISALNVVDSSLSEIQNNLFRILELAEQSANGIYTMVQRSAMELEVLALSSEIQRIAVATSYNGISLLSNSSSMVLQVGIDGGRNSRLILNGITGTLESLSLASSGSNQFNYTLLGSDSTEAELHSRTLVAATQAALNDVSSKRGEVGASSSRLESAISTLSSARENFINSANQITDVNVADEVANLVRGQILQQSQTAILAQANLQPKRVLDLLQ